MRDTSRIDAHQLRFRVFRDGGYFQFVTVPVPGPVLRAVLGLLTNTKIGQYWRAIAMAAGPMIKDAVRRREIPLDKPINAFEVYPDLEAAGQAATRVSDVAEGDTVFEFILDD